jgi:excisionase family DNA binding protein
MVPALFETTVMEKFETSTTLNNHQPLTASIKQAVVMTGLSRSTLYRLMDSKKLQFIKIGERRLISVFEIHRLIQQP